MDAEKFSPPSQPITTIKDQIEQRFGKVFNQATDSIEQIPFERINLNGHCGEVSKITQQTVGGKIRQFRTAGNKPNIFYTQDNGGKINIASGFTEAIHSYTIDEKGNVWDPITDNWGTVSEQEYLTKLSTS